MFLLYLFFITPPPTPERDIRVKFWSRWEDFSGPLGNRALQKDFLQ
jgi:hypothetical protein